MANQPEITSYDVGVYQIEATDPVDGGLGAITNSPLLSLANRTNYLKKHLDDIESGTFIPAGLAPLNSPALTGSPTAPTQAAGDNSTRLSNTAFVQGAVNGAVSVGVGGGATTTLTAAQYGVSIIVLTGAVTANKSVVFPAQSGHWQVVNNTSGAFTITLKTASGTGVVVTQGRSTNVFCDGTNVGLQQTDFISPALTGAPTAPSLVRFASGGAIINADTLNVRGNQSSGFRSIALSVTTVNLSASDAGSDIAITGSGGGTLVLPLANSVPSGAEIALRCNNTTVSTNTLKGAGSDTIGGVLGSGSNTAILRANDNMILVSDGVSKWDLAAESSSALLVQQLALAKGIQRFTASGSFTVPDGITKIWASGCAAGGGGGFSSNTTSNVSGGGGGGGAGQPLIRTQYTVAPGQVIPITIGSGGGSGSNGGNTVIGVLGTLVGGTAGNPGSNGSAGTAYGGTGGAGFPRGSDGQDAGNLAGTGNGGAGAGGPFGAGGGASRSAFGASPLAGGPAGGFGCGGGGAGGQSSVGTLSGALGGTGSPGLVIIEW